MKSMKKICIALAIIMAVIICFASCGRSTKGDITGFAAENSIIGREVPLFTVDENGDFTVLQFSDTHLISGSTSKDTKTLESIKSQIESINPDLVVISGDMIEGNNIKIKYNKETALQTIAEMFENFDQYWAYVPGNNDGEMNGSTDDVAAYLAQYDHCILSNVENVTGATHYTVDLLDSSDRTVHSLIFMDSLARDDNNNYDYMKDDQVDWAKNILEEKKSENPDMKVSFFFHMNTPNFANSGKTGEPYSADYAPIPNDFYDGIAGNTAIDGIMTGSGCVGLVSIGHVHPKTNYCSFMNGTYYHAVRPAGYSKSKKPGGVEITIHTSASSTRDMYDFSEIVFE
ncbi:MAG: metallophosphoesterase [Oscillospiraceae bacterium]|nr:metallophosphoesterase [Oscillospiraceae bacterium]